MISKSGVKTPICASIRGTPCERQATNNRFILSSKVPRIKRSKRAKEWNEETALFFRGNNEDNANECPPLCIFRSHLIRRKSVRATCCLFGYSYFGHSLLDWFWRTSLIANMRTQRWQRQHQTKLTHRPSIAFKNGNFRYGNHFWSLLLHNFLIHIGIGVSRSTFYLISLQTVLVKWQVNAKEITRREIFLLRVYMVAQLVAHTRFYSKCMVAIASRLFLMIYYSSRLITTCTFPCDSLRVAKKTKSSSHAIVIFLTNIIISVQLEFLKISSGKNTTNN